jgi:hypothetical protein
MVSSTDGIKKTGYPLRKDEVGLLPYAVQKLIKNGLST